MEPVCDMDHETFLSVVDAMYDELLIYDGNYRIVYINQACCRHYGCTPDRMIGRSFFDFVNDDWWNPSVLPVVYREKRAYAIKQKTRVGSELLTIAVPIFDADGEIAYVVMNVRDDVRSIDLYNPHYLSLETGREDKTPVALICESDAMRQVLAQVRRVARHDVPCLITGEVGVGKTLIAKRLYESSGRKSRPLCVIDCARATEDQVEVEFRRFHEEKEREEKIGTLLLRNVSQLSLKNQTSLLRLFPADDGARRKHVRVLATTNKNLHEMAKSGQFREELYYCLNVSDIRVPPLRKRREDIRPLTEMFFQNLCDHYAITRRLTEGVLQAMEGAEWSRNVEELRYVIERMIVMSDDTTIDVDQIPSSLFGIMDVEDARIDNTFETFDEKMERYESLLICDAYQKYRTSRQVAKNLGLSQTRANNLIRKHLSKQKG